MIIWRNLWKQFEFYPGTAKTRIKLTMWQLWLMAGSGLGANLWPAHSILASILGLVVAYESHELFFEWWAKKICGLQELDFAYWREQGWPQMTFVSTIERYWGPFNADKPPAPPA